MYFPRVLEILGRVKSGMNNVSAANMVRLQEPVLASRTATHPPKDLRGVCGSLELLLSYHFSGFQRSVFNIHLQRPWNIHGHAVDYVVEAF
jgi:hypothetical protein